jgi:metal-responsive CopG/Arc/MetJ family transcriptional regulator
MPTQDNEGKTIDVTVKFSVELIEKLEELSTAKYRGVNRSQAIRWIIEDAYQAWESEVIKK